MIAKIEPRFSTMTLTVRSEDNAIKAATALIKRSAWFVVEPRPDDEWNIEFKTHEGHAQAIADCLDAECLG